MARQSTAATGASKASKATTKSTKTENTKTKSEKKIKTTNAQPAESSKSAGNAASRAAPAAFPRGGACELTPLEYRDVTDQVKQDLFLEDSSKTKAGSNGIDNISAIAGSGDSTKGAKRRRGAADAADADAPSTDKDGKGRSKRAKAAPVAASGPSDVHALSFKALSVGMLTVGVIREIGALQMTVSLPGHLTGYVSIAEVSEYVSAQAERAVANAGDDDADDDDDDLPSLESLFAVGQPLICKVISLEREVTKSKDAGSTKAAAVPIKKKRIDLSIRPDQVNADLAGANLIAGMVIPASVVSIEDHGYVMSLGINGVSGFLRNDHAKAYIASLNIQELQVGAVVATTVLKVDAGHRTASLSIEPEALASTIIQQKENIELHHIRAGSLVSAKISDVQDDGIAVSVHRFFKATIDMFNLCPEAIRGAEDIAERFKSGSSIKARVIYVDHDTKRISLTLLPHLVQWQSMDFVVPDIGTIVSQIKVLRVDQGRGLLVGLPDGPIGHVHVSKISDDHVDKIDKSFRSGSMHRGRVVGVDPCSRLVNISFEKKVLSQPFLRYADVKAATTISGQILQLQPLGILVTVTDTIRGFCPRSHFSDANITKPAKLFPEGETKKFQVLSIDLESKKLILTHKKSLMNSTFAPITAYSDAQPGQIGIGTITAVKSFGCIVTFYNNVRALVPLPELSEEFVKDPTQMFKVGQTVKCRILTVEPSDEKMRASFKLSEAVGSAGVKRNAGSSTNTTNNNVADQTPPTPGQILSGSVVTKTENALLVRLENNHGTAMLSKMHLSDFPAHSKKKFDSIDAGAVLENVLVLSISNDGKVHITCKPSLLAQVRQDGRVRQFSDLEEGQILAGFIRNVSEKTCFVEFPGSIVAVANVHSISDAFVANVSEHLQIGQSVLAYITKLEPDASRVYVTLKASRLGSAASYRKIELERLRMLFAELDGFSTANAAKHAAKIVVGQTVTGVVDKKIPYGVLIKLEGGVSGLISRPVGDLAIGSSVELRVLDFDQQTRIADLTQMESGNRDSRRKTPATLKSQVKAAAAALASNQRLDAVVELIKDQYAVLTVPKLDDAVAVCLARAPNAVTGPFVRFKVGEQVQVHVAAVPDAKSNKVSFAAQRIFVVPAKTDVATKSLEGRRGLKNPIDTSIQSLDDVKLGAVIKGTVRSVKDTQVNVRLADNLSACVHATQVYDSMAGVADVAHPLAHFKVGETMSFKVVGFHDAKTHTFLPITHQKSSTQTIVELSVRPSDMALPPFELAESAANSCASFEAIQVGTEHIGVVQRVDPAYFVVQLGTSVSGSVPSLAASTDPTVASNLEKHFTVGRLVRCFIVSKDESKKRVELSLLSPVVPSAANLSVGQVTVARVLSINATKGLVVQLAKSLTARVHLTDLHDTFVENPTSAFTVGQYVRVVVVAVDVNAGTVDCATRLTAIATPSTDTQADSSTPSCAPTSIDQVEPGQLLQGYVRHINENGCFVSISRDIHARVKISDLSDAFLVDWKSAFTVGQLVRGRVVSVDVTKRQVEMSLRASAVDPDGASTTEPAGGLSFADLKIGQKVAGRVKRIESFGIFIELVNSNLSGLCHVSEVTDVAVKDLSRVYAVGDVVKAIVLRLNEAKKRISLGLKASYFNDDDAVEDDDTKMMDDSNNEDDDEEDDEDVEMDDVQNEVQGDNDIVLETQDDDTDEELGNSSGDDDDNDDEEDDGEDSDDKGDFIDFDDDDDDDKEEVNLATLTTSNSVALVEPLSLEGFSWDATETRGMGAYGSADEADEDGEEDDDDADDQGDVSEAKRSRRAKRRMRMEEEKRVAQEELALVDGDQAPEVAEDYERLLLGSPNNSYLWIKYMAFHLQMAEVDKARRVAERAIKSINFREEQERLNVWVALLNLENKYGSSETLDAVFARALPMNDPKTLYLQLARILERSNKESECIQLYQKMCKKLKGSAQVWLEHAAFLMRRGQHEAARKLLPRSLQSLPRHKHVDTTSRFAQMEFKLGEPERGRTVFEGLMNSCPKRADLWSVYLDMEIRTITAKERQAEATASTDASAPSYDKTADVDRVRRLFDCILARKWSTKKMRFYFKKSLEFEKKHGDERGVERVKDAAMRYVASL